MSHLEQYLENVQRFGIRPGLERVHALLQRAGNPQREYSQVLVGGTNGKGSTAEFLARALSHDGPTGLYTSPHLYNWNERLRVLAPHNATQKNRGLFRGAIPDSELDALFDSARPHLDAVENSELGAPTEFETLTFLALLYFARVGVKRAVIEVGLGGSWDATNAISPVVSVITHVALDHCDRLGNTLEEIARDKAGIARANCPLITAETKPQVLEVLRHECEARGAHLWPLRAPDFAGDNANFARAMQLAAPHFPPRVLARDADAPFQEINAATALLAQIALLQKEYFGEAPSREYSRDAAKSFRPSDFALPPDFVAARAAPVAGRTETLRENPLILLDGANNPDGAAHLAAHLSRVLAEKENRKLFLVLGISADKDYRAMISILAPLAHTVFATQANHPRALSAADLAQTAREYSQRVEVCKDADDAVQRALEVASSEDCICVCGSFFLLGDLNRDRFRE